MNALNLKVGLLPFYIELYDKVGSGERRKPLELFVAEIGDELRRRKLVVETAPICRKRREFADAVRGLETKGVDALVTLHLAYSPSLESAAVLAGTRLPLIVLDTTPDEAFGPQQAPARIMYNHGIHGVQDMCNLLLRNGKPFEIEAGHWRTSDVLDRVARRVRAARLARALQTARVGRIGAPFAGMGDFQVTSGVLRRRLGIETVPALAAELRKYATAVTESELAAEETRQRAFLNVPADVSAAYQRSLRSALAVRRWIADRRLTAFTANFLEVHRYGLPAMPFLEACLGLGRGIGYAGEGDVLTAAFVGALAALVPEVTFTEMFCPDWKGGRIFLSHMGEINYRLLVGRPGVREYPFIFGQGENPVRVVGRLRSGNAVFANLAPLPEQAFRLILAPVTVPELRGKDCFAETVHGWIKPGGKLDEFLAAYSRAGGTHHAALVYGDVLEDIAGMGRLLGWETLRLG